MYGSEKMEEKTLIRDLTTGSPIKQLIGFALPFMFSNMLQQAYTLADMIIVGRFVGSAGLAAASNAGESTMLYFFICLGFVSAGQIIVSQHIGGGSRTRLNAAIGTLFTFTFLLGVVCTVVSLLACDTVLRLVKIPEESMAYAHDYAMVCYCGNIPVFMYNAISAVLRGMGDSRHPTIFVATASVLNIGLDLLFVGPLGLECFGAALATVLAQTFAFVLSLVFVYRNRERFCFDFKRKSFAIDRHEFSTLMGLGFPIALQNVAVVVSMMFVNSFINAYGVVAAAVTAVGNKLTVLATICTGALNTAGSSIVAQNFAAGKFTRVSRTLLDILIIGLVFCALLSLVIVSFPEQTFAIFDSNPEVIAMSRTYAPVAVISLIGFATRSAAMALINGIGFSRLSFICGILDGIVFRIGLAVLFGMTLGMGVFGYWLGSAVAGHVFTVIGGIYFAGGWWKKRKPITV